MAELEFARVRRREFQPGRHDDFSDFPAVVEQALQSADGPAAVAFFAGIFEPRPYDGRRYGR